MVELDARAGLVGKPTIPPAFGLVPELRRHSLAVLRLDADAPHEREAIEFVPATPLEYLSRWLASNEILGDDVRLVSVIHWTGGMISFGITQPQYHGVPAEPREIEAFFHEAGWPRLNDPSGHAVFCNRFRRDGHRCGEAELLRQPRQLAALRCHPVRAGGVLGTVSGNFPRVTGQESLRVSHRRWRSFSS